MSRKLQATMTSISPIERLPLEIILIICQDLEQYECFRFSRASQKLYRILAPTLWACLRLKIETQWYERRKRQTYKQLESVLHAHLAKCVPLFILESPKCASHWITRLDLDSQNVFGWDDSWAFCLNESTAWPLCSKFHDDPQFCVYNDDHCGDLTIDELKKSRRSTWYMESHFYRALKKLFLGLSNLKIMTMSVWPFNRIWKSSMLYTTHRDLCGLMNLQWVSFTIIQIEEKKTADALNRTLSSH